MTCRSADKITSWNIALGTPKDSDHKLVNRIDPFAWIFPKSSAGVSSRMTPVRLHEPGGLSYELVRLPSAVQKRILTLTSDIGVNFASIDLGEDRDGEFWFFDLNPGGQWLFLEQKCESPSLLAAFCAYFAYGSTARASQFSTLKDFVAAGGEATFFGDYERAASKIRLNASQHTWSEV